MTLMREDGKASQWRNSNPRPMHSSSRNNDLGLSRPPGNSRKRRFTLSRRLILQQLQSVQNRAIANARERTGRSGLPSGTHGLGLWFA